MYHVYVAGCWNVWLCITCTWLVAGTCGYVSRVRGWLLERVAMYHVYNVLPRADTTFIYTLGPACFIHVFQQSCGNVRNKEIFYSLNGLCLVSLHQLEKSISLPNLWNLFPIHVIGYIFKSAQFEEKNCIFDRYIKLVQEVSVR